MKHLPLVILIILFSKIASSQNTNLDYKSAIKIYNQTSFENSDRTNRLDSSHYLDYHTSNLQIAHPTIAYQRKTKKNNFREFELTAFSISKNKQTIELHDNVNGTHATMGSSRTSNSYISLRYEYIITFFKNKEKKLVPSIGLGFNPYFSKSKNLPLASSTFYETISQSFGLKAFVSPRLTYYFSKKIFLDLNVPLNIQDFSFNTTLNNDPIIPTNQRKVTTMDFNMFHNFASLRIGLGIKI